MNKDFDTWWETEIPPSTQRRADDSIVGSHDMLPTRYRGERVRAGVEAAMGVGYWEGRLKMLRSRSVMNEYLDKVRLEKSEREDNAPDEASWG